MTDEERQNVLQRLRASAPITKYDAIKAADEIERLAKRVEELERECGRFENELFEARSALAQSDEEPDPTKVICPNCAHQFGAISVADQERLRAQSDAELPKEVRDAWQHYYHEAPVDFDPVAEEIFEAGWKAALAQSDAEPWRCPIGIPPESHNICSAGSCWWCLSDRVKAQADRSGK